MDCQTVTDDRAAGPYLFFSEARLATAEHGEQDEGAQHGDEQGAETTEPVGEENEHSLSSIA